MHIKLPGELKPALRMAAVSQPVIAKKFPECPFCFARVQQGRADRVVVVEMLPQCLSDANGCSVSGEIIATPS